MRLLKKSWHSNAYLLRNTCMHDYLVNHSPLWGIQLYIFMESSYRF